MLEHHERIASASCILEVSVRVPPPFCCWFSIKSPSVAFLRPADGTVSEVATELLAALDRPPAEIVLGKGMPLHLRSLRRDNSLRCSANWYCISAMDFAWSDSFCS